MQFTTKNLVTMALLSALAYASTFFFNWSFIPAAPFLTYDPKDVFIITGGFFFGPLAVVMMSATVSLVEMVTISKDGIVGMVANMLSTCSFALVATLIFRIRKNLLLAVIGVIAGVLCMTPIMLLWNWLIVPLYMKMGEMSVSEIREHVKTNMLIPFFLPFNLIKGGVNAGITIALYKPVKIIFEKSKIT